MRLISVTIRGAIGLTPYGETVVIPFERFDPGPIALVGPNGAGKSTILENLHPWPRMVTYSGSLTNHFYLKDSLREIRFEYSGHIYTSRFLIDGEKNKIETYLYREDQPLNDGKTPSYKKLVDELFGDPDLFFKSIFLSQNGDRISTLKAGESKKFFAGLMGLDRYQLWSSDAKERASQLSETRAELSGKIQQLEETIKNSEGRLSEREIIEREIRSIQEIIRGWEAGLSAVDKEINETQVQAVERQSIIRQIDELKEEISFLNTEHDDLVETHKAKTKEIESKLQESQQGMEKQHQYLEHADTIRNKAKRFKELQQQDSELSELKQRVSELNIERKSRTIKIENEIKSRTDRINLLAQQIIINEKAAGQLDVVPCNDNENYVKTCPLIENARKGRDEVARLKKELAELEAHKDDPIPEQSQLDTLDVEIKAIPYDISRHNEIRDELKKLRERDWTKLISDLDKAETTIEGLEVGIEKLEDRLTEIAMDYDSRSKVITTKRIEKEKDLEQLNKSLSQMPEVNITKLQDKKSDIQNALSYNRTKFGEVQGRLKMLDELAETNEKQKEELKQLSTNQDILNRDISDWKFLELACGKNGLQALELDSAIPQISNIATEILQEFGREWSIAISTIRDSSDGKKEIEDFRIMVSRPGGVVELDKLSGGQKVWIEESLRKAVTIYLIKHSGRDYRTILQDEADGPLDPDRAEAFLKTAFKAHELTGAYHTILITQRPEIWNQVPQRIHLNPETGKIEMVMN